MDKKKSKTWCVFVVVLVFNKKKNNFKYKTNFKVKEKKTIIIKKKTQTTIQQLLQQKVTGECYILNVLFVLRMR